MRSACVVPAKGRLPLLEITLNRLKVKNRIDHIIVVGHENQVADMCNELGVEFLYHPNNPLGAKWNYGFNHALTRYDPDAYLFCGSSDWLTSNWMDYTMPLLEEFDLVGKPDMYLYDAGEYSHRLCHWPGYVDASRKGESIGIGRVLSSRIMKLMNGCPFRPDQENSLDYAMYHHVLSKGGKVKLIEDSSLKSLSVSCFAWSNKHSFSEHWSGILPSVQMGEGKEWLNQHFEGWEVLRKMV